MCIVTEKTWGGVGREVLFSQRKCIREVIAIASDIGGKKSEMSSTSQLKEHRFQLGLVVQTVEHRFRNAKVSGCIFPAK